MYTQFKVLLFIFILNLTCYVVMSAVMGDGNPLVPGVQYSQPLNATADLSEIEQQFNATEMVEEWDTPPEVGIPLFGDIYYATVSFAKKMQFLFDGFAMTFDWMGGFISQETNALNWIAWIIRGIGAIMVGTLIFEIISGRKVQE